MKLEQKYCYCCKEHLAIEMFGKNKSKRDGLTTECRSCKKATRKPEPYNPEGASKRQKKYYAKNAEILKEKARQYGADHKEQIRIYNKEYSEKNKTKILKRHKDNYDNNPEKFRKRAKEFRAKIKEENGVRYENHLRSKLASDKRRRASKRNCLAIMTADQYDECLEFFGHVDAYTGLPMEVVTQDHVIPLSKGGSHIKTNIVPCDLMINAMKATKDFDTWYKKQTFFCEQRFQRIKQWMGYKPNSDILQTSFF